MYNKDRKLQRSNNKTMGKYNLKKQTGAISVFVMMAMLFFLLTILGIYLISTKRAQAQTEAFRMAQERYYSEDAASIYNDKMANLEPNGKIPIYTKEQLWSIGEPKKIEIEGKMYDFSEPDSSNKYELKNDIIINIPESEPLEIFNGNIEMNGYGIYYFYKGNYYIPANGATPILSKGGNDFIYKDNLNQTLGYVTDGLLLHYDGIKNAGTRHDSNATTWKDLSGNGNDGILNGATWEENSLNFDGINDFVNVNESDKISPQNQTIEVVLKCNGASKETSADKRQIFFVKWIGYTMELNTDNTISYGRSNATGYLRSTNKLSHGTITNITATNGNNISTLYVNNIQENQAQTVPAEYSGMKNISIGNYSNGRHFYGNIYTIRMYDRVLTEEERVQNYEIDKKRFGFKGSQYGTDIQTSYPEIYVSADSKNKVTQTNKHDLDGGKGNYLYPASLSDKLGIGTYVTPTTTSVENRTYIASGENTINFTRPIEQNRWIKMYIQCAYGTTNVSISNLNLIFSDSVIGSISSLVEQGYIEPLVIASSAYRYGERNYAWTDFFNIVNGGRTETTNYPCGYIYLKTKDKYNITGMKITSSVDFTNTNKQDGIQVLEYPEDVEISISPF